MLVSFPQPIPDARGRFVILARDRETHFGLKFQDFEGTGTSLRPFSDMERSRLARTEHKRNLGSENIIVKWATQSSSGSISVRVQTAERAYTIRQRDRRLRIVFWIGIFLGCHRRKTALVRHRIRETAVAIGCPIPNPPGIGNCGPTLPPPAPAGWSRQNGSGFSGLEFLDFVANLGGQLVVFRRHGTL